MVLTDTTTIAVVAGLGGMFGWGLADLFAKKTIDEIGDTPTLVWAHVLGTGLIIIALGAEALLGRPVALPATAPGWLGLAGFGALQAAVYLLVYRGFGKGQVAVLAPVFASFSGLVALTSVLVLGEPASAQKLAALAVIFVGILALNVEPEALRRGRIRLLRVPGFGEIAAATVLATIWTLGWNQFVGGRDWLASAAAMYALMTAALLIYCAIRREPLKFSHRPAWKFLALIGACEVIAYAAVSWGYGATPHTSIVALVSGAFSLPTIVLARLVLKEKTGWLRAVASVVIVTGIVLLNVG